MVPADRSSRRAGRTTRRWVRLQVGLLAAVLLTFATAAPSWGQSAPEGDDEVPPEVTAGEGGFTIASGDGDFVLDIGVDAQFDGRFLVGEVPSNRSNTFELRRLRPKLGATIARRHRVSVVVDFAGGDASLKDAFIRSRLAEGLSLQVGRFKMPVGLEYLQSSSDLLLAERGLPTDLVPGRDLGVVLNGRLLDGALQVHAGMANGVTDGASGIGDVDTKKDAVGRIFVEPVRGERFGIGVGVGGSIGVHEGSLDAPQVPSFETVGRQRVFRYQSEVGFPNAEANGRVTRIVPQTYVHAGPVGLLGEYAYSSQEVAEAPPEGPVILIAPRTARLQNQAWQVAASVVLTGENATFGDLLPKRPFDPSRGQWGAVELAGRVQQLHIDEAAFPAFANPATQAERITSIGAGVKWILDANVRLIANYVVTQAETPTGTDLLSPETLFLARFQLNF